MGIVVNADWLRGQVDKMASVFDRSVANRQVEMQMQLGQLLDQHKRGQISRDEAIDRIWKTIF